MKKANWLRIICTCLAICLFAGMAMASGSSTTETTSITIADKSAKKDSDDANSDEKENETSEEKKEEISYEITHTTFTHYTNSINREEYCGIVEITNTGDSYLYLGECSFDLEDDDGHLLQVDKMISNGPDVIAPGESGYYFNDGMVDEGVSIDNGINLVPSFSVEICKQGEKGIVEYPVSDLDLRDNDYGLGIKVTGRMENNTDEATSALDVKIIAVFFDSEGEILDIGYTYPDEVGAGSKVSFEVSTVFGNSEVSTSDVADYKVVARGSYYNW